MSIKELGEYPKTDQEITDKISAYIKPNMCNYCKSDNLIHVLSEVYTICRNCLKHILFKERFHFLEAEILVNKIPDPELITANIIKQTIILSKDAYDLENQSEGSYYYMMKKLGETL